NITMARLFVRQIFSLGGESEPVEAEALQLAGRRDLSRLTLTLGKLSARDVFDQNAFAGDAQTQFMNWALVANEAWDFPADAIGYIRGFTAELALPQWAVRYGFFQMPRVSNGVAIDQHVLEAWGMAVEIERDFKLAAHPGAARALVYLNRARMGSYEASLE